ncbi:MAG: hypothetical protein R3325_05295 [Thermoanaerobaculia bacterium]|nr:hypothetical protein [Thermoanaerobaculia bacterium]
MRRPGAARPRLLPLLPLALALAGCSQLEAPPAPAERPADLLRAAETELGAGDLAGAAAGYRLLVETHPASAEAAQALFQLAALRLAPESPVRDPQAALEALRRIEAEHPGSVWAPAAGAVLALARTNADLERALARLQAQLDEIKRLDLGPDG